MTDAHKHKPTNTPLEHGASSAGVDVSSSGQLEFSEFTQKALNELESLFHALQKNTRPSSDVTKPSTENHSELAKESPSTTKKDQTNSAKGARIPPPQQPPQEKPVPAVTSSRKSKTSKPKFRRGAQEIQTSLFDEPACTSAPSLGQTPEPNTHQATTHGLSEELVNDLVDQLVAQYLPEIEQRLRAELKRRLGSA